MLLLLALLVQPVIHAQKAQRFSGDSTKFIGELNTAFENLPDNEKKMAIALVQDFMQKWNQEKYNPSQKKIIYQVCNGMAKKKCQVFPDLYNYIQSISSFVNTYQPEKSFYDWSAILLKLLDSKSMRDFNQFVAMSVDLFNDDLLYRSSSTRWKILQPEFQFLYDSVPMIEFKPTAIVCYANNDSLTIFNTQGLYYPLSTLWIGRGGKVDWRRAGLDPGQVFATLSDYQIQMRFSKFTVDSVVFYHRKYFNYPLMGRYIDKVQADVTEEKASYPRFSSYDRQIGIKNLFPGIDYLGGFSLEGARVIGTGMKPYQASLTFKRNEKECLVIRSNVFVIRPDRVNSGIASVTIYHDDDSIFHPGLQMKYIDEFKELTLSRDERITTVSPWFDSWHQIEIYCESFTWKTNESNMRFEMMKGPNQEGKAVFESSNYYSAQRYDKLQGMDEQNPLYRLMKFSELKKSRDFTLDEMTSYFQKPPDQVEAQILSLAYRGFLIYDPESHSGIIKDKVFNYVNARNGSKDYDVIFFNSAVSNQSNAILNLDSFDLRIQGVPSVYLSDSQQVYIYPTNQEIILLKNRDFVFSGKVEAGLFDMYTKNSYFDYTKFKLDLPEIDSMGFYVKSWKKDQRTQTYPLVRVKTYINKVSGDLLIDDPGNKSGLKSFPDYPVFTSKNDAVVNWERKEIQNGVYKQDRFFYDVFPFTFKNIDAIPTDSLRFKGFLSSAGIFPDIRQPLQVRPDYSLGIETRTDTTGLPIYGGKGRFVNHIDMSNEGLHGDGTLVYLNSVSRSKDYIFYPDSMKTTVRSFSASEQIAAVEYPSVSGDSLREFWLPYHDSLVLNTLRKDVSMYNNQSAFNGQLALTPNGMTGEGTVKIRDAEMDSRQFKFKRRTFDANIANFRIKSYNLAELSISTKNYQTHFDFDQRRGEFKSNIGISKVEFPFNKYTCSMDRFDWMIDNQEISMSNEYNKQVAGIDTMTFDRLIGVDFTGSEFISEHPSQDSLRFFALKARYNLKTNVINAEDVRIIKVADAAIFPDSGKVCILKDAQMQPLVHAAIIANTTTRYHHFYNANVSIISRKKYTASASYDYVDRESNQYAVRFNTIVVDTSGQTVAKGNVPPASGFYLSPEFTFHGDVMLLAARKNLEFDGGFNPVNDCFGELKTFTQFDTVIDPTKVQIPLASPLREMNSEKLALGIFYSNAGNRIYPAFFTKQKSFSDSLLVTAMGVIDYSPATGEFRVSSPGRLQSTAVPDNLVSLNTSRCILHAEGRLNMGLNSGPLNMETYGSMNDYLIPDSVNAQVAVAFDFPFSDDALAKFTGQLASINLDGLIYASSPYASAIQWILGRKEYEKIRSEVEMYGRFRKFPEDLNLTLFLADVHFRWDSNATAWVSYGRIGIGNVEKTQVNRYVHGIIEFAKKRNGDDFTMYLELTPNDWYFFNYRNNILQAISSNLEFNDLIMNAMKSRAEQNRVNKISKGFRYVISTDRKKRDFLRKYQKDEE
jgi:hypothetical protein